MKVVLGTLLARYRFTLVRAERERPVMRNLAMGPQGRVRVTAAATALPGSASRSL